MARDSRDSRLRALLGCSCAFNIAAVCLFLSLRQDPWDPELIRAAAAPGAAPSQAAAVLAEGPRAATVAPGTNATMCETATLRVCTEGYYRCSVTNHRLEDRRVLLARAPAHISHADLTEACLSHQLPRPGTVVKGPGGVAVEVTRLNSGEETKCGFMTQPGCPPRWDSDAVGRPLNLTTAEYQRMAVKVSHPANGMLDITSPPPRRKCASAVPKVLHFIWIGDRLMKAKHLRNIAVAAATNPLWKVILWQDRPCSAKERTVLDEWSNVTSRAAGPVVTESILGVKSSLRNWDIIDWMNKSAPQQVGAALSDVLRLEFIYLYGGIYMDIDTVAYHGFDEYGTLFWWPFVTHKVCGVNIGNNVMGFDRSSGFLDFALDAFRDGCRNHNRCWPYTGAGPPFMAMAVLRYNDSDISFIGQQYFSASDSNALSVLGHFNDMTWGRPDE